MDLIRARLVNDVSVRLFSHPGSVHYGGGPTLSNNMAHVKRHA